MIVCGWYVYKTTHVHLINTHKYTSTQIYTHNSCLWSASGGCVNKKEVNSFKIYTLREDWTLFKTLVPKPNPYVVSLLLLLVLFFIQLFTINLSINMSSLLQRTSTVWPIINNLYPNKFRYNINSSRHSSSRLCTHKHTKHTHTIKHN